MTARYLLCPGPVVGRDGSVHHLDAYQLARLYGVPMSICEIPIVRVGHGLSKQHDADLKARVASGELIELRPRNDGNYRLPVAPGQRGGMLLPLLVFLAVMCATWFACSGLWQMALPPHDSTDPPGDRSDLVIRVDELTGCQYLTDARHGGMTPRLDAQGRPICDRGAPR